MTFKIKIADRQFLYHKIPASLGVGVSPSHPTGPCAVVWPPSGQVTLEWLQRKVDDLMRIDDVLEPAFLENIILLRQAGEPATTIGQDSWPLLKDRHARCSSGSAESRDTLEGPYYYV